MHDEGDIGAPIINFATERVGLGPMRRDLIPTYQRWINDIEVGRFVGRTRPMTEEQETRWFDSVASDQNGMHFTIYEMDAHRPIGTIGLNGINHEHGSAVLGILIGEGDARGRGYGTAAVRLLCDFGFNALGLSNIMLTLIAFNERGLRAYKSVGFREIGRRRACRVMGGRRFDEIYMDLLAEEFESPILAKRLTEPPRR